MTRHHLFGSLLLGLEAIVGRQYTLLWNPGRHPPFPILPRLGQVGDPLSPVNTSQLRIMEHGHDHHHHTHSEHLAESWKSMPKASRRITLIIFVGAAVGLVE